MLPCFHWLFKKYDDIKNVPIILLHGYGSDSLWRSHSFHFSTCQALEWSVWHPPESCLELLWRNVWQTHIVCNLWSVISHFVYPCSLKAMCSWHVLFLLRNVLMTLSILVPTVRGTDLFALLARVEEGKLYTQIQALMVSYHRGDLTRETQKAT